MKFGVVTQSSHQIVLRPIVVLWSLRFNRSEPVVWGTRIPRAQAVIDLHTRIQITPTGKPISKKMRDIVEVNDLMQTGYRYELTEPVGGNFDPEFKPDLTPKQMLELGVFGGKYMTDCREEFPEEWFKDARLCPERHDPELNLFGINASRPLSVWREKGWIHPDDPRGWFQWYCRYYMGRRMAEEDARQVRRWKSMRRHVAQLQKNCVRGDYECRRKQRQALLHWAYDSRRL